MPTEWTPRRLWASNWHRLVPLKPLVPSYHLGIAPECSYSIILESNRKHLMLHESIILKLVLDLEIKYKYQPMTADWSFRVSTTKLVFAAALMRVFVTLAALRFSGTTASNCTWREIIMTYQHDELTFDNKKKHRRELSTILLQVVKRIALITLIRI